jgi:hypothetical protein
LIFLFVCCINALQDHRKFQQRYYEFLDYFKIPDGPVFLVICGEYSCNGIKNDYIGVSCYSWPNFVQSYILAFVAQFILFVLISLDWVRYIIVTNKIDCLSFKYTCVLFFNIYRFWQRSLEQLWFLLNIAIMGRVRHLNLWKQKTWDIFHPSRHCLIWPFSDRIIRQVTFLFDFDHNVV